jgi:hypothetical protein
LHDRHWSPSGGGTHFEMRPYYIPNCAQVILVGINAYNWILHGQGNREVFNFGEELPISFLSKLLLLIPARVSPHVQHISRIGIVSNDF